MSQAEFPNLKIDRTVEMLMALARTREDLSLMEGERSGDGIRRTYRQADVIHWRTHSKER
jgi:hypothetical protein